jgi:hypothetical protein
MSEIDLTLFEILKMSRELVINEYINLRAEEHNKWVAESEISWKTSRIRVPYPPITPYPTEEMIVARAKILYDFLNQEKKDDPIDASFEEVVDELPNTSKFRESSMITNRVAGRVLQKLEEFKTELAVH